MGFVTGARKRKAPIQRRLRGGADPVLAIRKLAAEEIGAVVKPFGAQTPFALVYPNTYHVAMSSLGFQTLAGRINRRADAACERFFWSATGDGRDEVPLSVENQRGLAEFPLVAFSVAFEMDYINVLDVLRRAGIPLRRDQRSGGDPIILCGGKAPTMNRLPLYDFIDVFVHGDGEEAVDRILDTHHQASGREDFLQRLGALPGFEAPSLAPDPPPAPPASLSLAERLAEFPCHSTILTPNTELSMRALVEISRGCPYRCAFCIMGYQPYRYRWRSPDDVIEMARLFKPHTDKIGLVASAVGVHKHIEEICERLDAMEMKVAFSSLRVEDVKPAMVRSLIRSGQRTLTIAPEAGNDPLRLRLRKNLGDEQIEDFVAWSLGLGMENLKLYYMIGIPGETDDDVLSIARLTRRLHDIQVRVVRPRGRIGRLALNVGIYVPKPGTPLAEGGFCGVGEAKRRIRLLTRALSDIPNIKVHCESPREAAAQALLAVGDRDVGRLIEEAALTGKRIPVREQV